MHLNFEKLCLISVAFQLLFIAFNSASNLSGELMKQAGFGDLGLYNLAILYLFVSLCSVFSTAIVNKLGVKKALFVGSMCYVFWILSFLLPSLYKENKNSGIFLFNYGFITFLSLFSSAVNGLGAGLIWVAQGKYVTQCASDKNKGFFYGFFWVFYMSSQVLGNLIAALVLGNANTVIYYSVMGAFAFSSSFLFLILKKPQSTAEDSIRQLINTKDMPASQTNFKQDIKDTISLALTKRMLQVAPMIVQCALSITAFSGMFVSLMTKTMVTFSWEQNKQTQMAMLAMIALGFGEIFGALISGKVIDKYGKKAGVMLTLIMMILAFAFLFLVVALYEFSFVTFLMTFFWGLYDSSLNNLLNCVYGFEFDSKILPFSVSKLFKTMLIFVSLMLATLVKEQTDYYIFFIAVAVFSFPATLKMLTFKFRNQRETDFLYRKVGNDNDTTNDE